MCKLADSSVLCPGSFDWFWMLQNQSKEPGQSTQHLRRFAKSVVLFWGVVSPLPKTKLHSLRAAAQREKQFVHGLKISLLANLMRLQIKGESVKLLRRSAP